MIDRDHFAAAALTGLLSDKANQWPTALQWEHLLTHAYRWADAMLRERERTDLDAAPAARVRTDAAAGEPGGGAGAGNQTAPPCVETDGSSPAIAQPPASSDGRGEGRGHFPDSRNAKQDPVAWIVHSGDLRWFAWAKPADGLYDGPIVPLYSQPQPTLADQEREAIRQAAMRLERTK
jgi:hypothetical protein